MQFKKINKIWPRVYIFLNSSFTPYPQPPKEKEEIQHKEIFLISMGTGKGKKINSVTILNLNEFFFPLAFVI